MCFVNIFSYFLFCKYIKIFLYVETLLFVLRMSYIQLPFGQINTNEKFIKLTNFPKNRNADFLFSQLRYLDNTENAEFQNSIIDIINTRENLLRSSSF